MSEVGDRLLSQRELAKASSSRSSMNAWRVTSASRRSRSRGANLPENRFCQPE